MSDDRAIILPANISVPEAYLKGKEDQKKKLIAEFLEKIDYYLKTDDCDPIAYFCELKREYERKLNEK